MSGSASRTAVRCQHGRGGDTGVRQASEKGQLREACCLAELITHPPLTQHGSCLQPLSSGSSSSLAAALLFHQLLSHQCRAEMERWPQYRGRIVLDAQGNPHIHLSVLTYFLFWTAFYVLRGSHASHTTEAARPARTLSLTPNFGSVKKVRGAAAVTCYTCTRVACLEPWSPCRMLRSSHTGHTTGAITSCAHSQADARADATAWRSDRQPCPGCSFP